MGTVCLFSWTACVLQGELVTTPLRLNNNHPEISIFANPLETSLQDEEEVWGRPLLAIYTFDCHVVAITLIPQPAAIDEVTLIVSANSLTAVIIVLARYEANCPACYSLENSVPLLQSLSLSTRRHPSCSHDPALAHIRRHACQFQ